MGRKIDTAWTRTVWKGDDVNVLLRKCPMCNGYGNLVDQPKAARRQCRTCGGSGKADRTLTAVFAYSMEDFVQWATAKKLVYMERRIYRTRDRTQAYEYRQTIREEARPVAYVPAYADGVEFTLALSMVLSPETRGVLESGTRACRADPAYAFKLARLTRTARDRRTPDEIRRNLACVAQRQAT